MYSITRRRVCSLLLQPTTHPSPLLHLFATSNSHHLSSSLLRPSASRFPHQLLRSFARRSHEPDDEEDDVMEEDMKTVDQELEEEEERRQARGPSKAERLRLKEKEKRRQKLAMRERVDNKKEKKEGVGRRRGGRGLVDDEFDEDVSEMYDDLRAGDGLLGEDERAALAGEGDGVEDELVPLPSSLPVKPHGRGDAAKAYRLAQKKQQLKQRFEQQDDDEDEDEAEEEKDEDKRPVNEAITAPAIVLIDGAGKRIGLVATPVALKKARDSQLDIVTLSPPHIQPPICRVVDYSDWLQLERQKKGQQDESNKRTKTLQIRKLIDRHDLEIKAAAMRRFLSRGHVVRVQYFEKEPVEAEWQDLFARVAVLVEGAGVSHDLLTKPTATFEPVRKKKEGEEVKQGKKAQKQKKLEGGAVPVEERKEGGVEGAASHVESGRSAEITQHAAAGSV